MKAKLWTDAGLTKIAYVLETELETISGMTDIPRTPVNQAEYTALCYALRIAQQELLDITELEIYTDSQVMARQLYGAGVRTLRRNEQVYDAHTDELKMWLRTALLWLDMFESVSVTWVPRKKNKAGILLEEQAKR